MDLKTLKFHILHGYVGRRVVLRSFALTFAASVLLWLQFIGGADPASVTSRGCANPALDLSLATNSISNRFLKSILGGFQFGQCQENVNLTVAVVEELVSKKLLSYGAKALCVGEGSATAVLALRELGFSDACGVFRPPFFSLRNRKFVYELDYGDNSFDFVLSRDLDKAPVPALLVLQIERILKPGGIGAMLVGDGVSNPNGLIRSATPVSLLLKNSSVVHVAYVNSFALVVFRKKIENVGYFGQFRLTGYCPSLVNNKPFIPHLEPLVSEKPVGFEKKLAYLPKFVDVSSKKRPVYIDVGAGEHLNSSANSWFLPNYPMNPEDFNVYLVDHNTSVLLFHVKKPGITFVYHPGLAGYNVTANVSSEDDPALGDEGFDFLGWFKETVEFADFVVLKMKTGDVELKFLSDLFDSGAICFVDELFLNCSSLDSNGAMDGDCMNLFKDLRSSGVFVHQWWEQ